MFIIELISKRGDFQMPGTDDGSVRQKLARGLPKCQEGALSLEPARENC